MSHRLRAILVLVILSSTVVIARQSHVRVDVRLVNVLAIVTDTNGRYVDGLNKDDFILQEDGAVQEIAHFSHDLDVPVSVGIVFDTSGSMQNKLRTAVAAVDRFVRTIHPEDDIFLMTFANGVDLRQDFTDNRESLSRALRGISATGATSLYDALDQGLDKIKSGRHRKRAILLLTDGEDNGSTATYGEVLQRIRESELVVYTLGISPATNGGPKRRDSVDMNVLQSLASASGGRAFLLSDILVGTSGTQTERILTLIAEELRSQYTLAFYPKHPDDGQFHSLKIRTRAGLVARTRPGYVAR